MSDFPELNRGYGLLEPELARSIGRITCRFGSLGDETILPGTGFLIRRLEGRCFFATAGHVLHDFDHGRMPSRIQVKLGLGGGGATRAFSFSGNLAGRCFVPDAFLQNGPGRHESDFGLLRIDNPIAGFDCFDRASVLTKMNVAKLVGYPQHDGEAQASEPWHANLELADAGGSNFAYVHQQTFDGMSGGPLLGQTTTDAKTRAFGLHIRGTTSFRAVRFTDQVRGEMNEWMRAQVANA